jgi:F-box/WD-40 domain protein MET30
MELEEHAMREEAGEPPSKDNCDSKHEGHDPTITISSTSRIAGQTVAPFLAKHIPEQYAPLGTKVGPTSSQAKAKDPNTKYCYRHRPDSKCRRTADEPSMENLQRVC